LAQVVLAQVVFAQAALHETALQKKRAIQIAASIVYMVLPVESETGTVFK